MWQGEEELLRKSYDARSKGIADRLHAARRAMEDDPSLRVLQRDPAANADFLQHRMQEIVDDELAHERQRQVDDLVRKVSALQADRQHIRSELEHAEQRGHEEAQTAQRQVDHVHTEAADMEKEVARLVQQIKGSQKQQGDEKIWIEKSKNDAVARLKEDLSSLAQRRETGETELSALRIDCQDGRQRVEELYRARMQAQQAAAEAMRVGRVLHTELEAAQSRLTDAEQNRNELRERYVVTGERFERAMDLSEKENKNSVAELQHDLKSSKHKIDRYQRQLRKIQGELTSLDSEACTQKSRLDELTEELDRTNRRLEEERVITQGREQQLIELQQRSLRDQNQEMKKLGEMISTVSHQKVLEEQAKQYRASMRELETKLKQQLEAIRESSQQKTEQSIQETRATQERIAAQQKQAFTQRQSTARRARELDAELARMIAHQRQVEVNLARAEEQKRAFGISLNEATANLARLQHLVDEEHRQRAKAEAELQRLREGFDELVKELHEREAGVIDRRKKYGNIQTLESTVAAQSQQIPALEASRDNAREEWHAVRLEVHEMKGEIKDLTLSTETAECRAAELKAHRQHAERCRHRQREALLRAQLELRRHLDFSRRGLKQMREEVKVGTQRIVANCEEQAQQWCAATISRRRRQQAEMQSVRHAADAELHRRGDLERLLASHTAEVMEAEHKLTDLNRDLQVSEDAVRRLQDEASQRALDAERLLMTTASAVPGSITDGTKALLLSEMDAPTRQFLEALAPLRSDLTAALDGVKAEAAALARGRAELEVEAREREAAALLTTHRSELVAVENSEEHLHSHLETELCERRASAEEAASERNSKLAELEANTAKTQEQITTEEALLQQRSAEVDHLSRRISEVQVEASVMAQVTQTETTQPLRRQLEELFIEVDDLQRRFLQDWEEGERNWVLQLEKRSLAIDEEVRERREKLRSQENVLRTEVDEARAAERQSAERVDRRVGELREQLARTATEVDDRSNERRGLECELQAAQREERRQKDRQETTEWQLSEMSEAQRHDRDDLRKNRERLQRQHDADLALLRRDEEAELSKIRSSMRLSFSTISASSLDETLGEHSRLEATAAALAERARLQLSDAA